MGCSPTGHLDTFVNDEYKGTTEEVTKAPNIGLPGNPGGKAEFLPRVIRLKDTPTYLGMNRNLFNAEVRPFLTEIPIGTQGIAFDRLDLDAWVDDYKSRNGRPGLQPKGERLWDVKERQASSNGAIPGISTSKSGEADFAKALVQATSMKQRNT